MSRPSVEIPMRSKFVAVFEQRANNYSACVSDLPACVSTGKTWDKMQDMIREAITGGIEVMLEYCDPLPKRHMSLEEAMVYHSELLTEIELTTLAEFGDDSPTLSVTFKEIEVAVSIPQLVTTG